VIGSGCNQSSSQKFDGGIFETATITVTPTAHTYSNTALSMDSAPAKFQLSNIGFEASGPVSHIIDGPNASEFVITGSTCGQPLTFQATCDVTVIFRPLSPGPKSARLVASATPGTTFNVLLNANSQAPGSLQLTPTVHDFPSTAIPGPGAPAVMPPIGQFMVVNTGGLPLGPLFAEITGQDAADFAIAQNTCQGATVSSGGNCQIAVRFKPITSGQKSANLTVTAGSVKLDAGLFGEASEPAKVTLTPMAQSFGTVPIGMKSAYSFEIKNEGGSNAGKLNFSLEGMNFTEFSFVADSSCAAMELEPTFGCIVTVTFAPTLPGTKTASLRVTASPGGLARVDFNGTGELMNTQGMLRVASPVPDAFGTVPAGETSVGFFVVENKGTMPTGKINAAISGSNAAEFAIADNGCPDMLPVGAQCGISVRFTPQFAGRRTANLQVSAFPGGFAILPLSGNATTAIQLRVSPTSRSFGTRNVGSTTMTPIDFTFSVSGVGVTGPLNVALEGVDANHFQIAYNDCQNQQLQQGRSCRVSLRFIPMSNGYKTATIGASASPGGVIRSFISGTGN
jgi:hypothetical protein